MAESSIFLALKSKRMCREIASASERVIYAAPGLKRCVAESLIHAAKRLGVDSVTIVLDCNEDTCRLGYGYIDAIRLLESYGVRIRQSPGLRFGLLICDGQGWSFSPVALYVEDETFSDETPNAAQLVSEQVETFVAAICPQEGGLKSEQGAEVGVDLLTEVELRNVEENLKEAPPQRFDIMRQVRVFQPYIQYVELHLKGCSTNRKVVNIPHTVLNRRISEELEGRLKTKFELISRKSGLSDRKLQDEIEGIRRKYTKVLGRPWKRIMLRSKRDEFDKEIETLRKEVKAHQASIEARLQEEIDNSKGQIVDAFWQEVMNNPPGELAGQIISEKPDEETARRFLEYKLDGCFPRAKQIISKMVLECQFSDVTYETLTQEGFADALKKAFPFVNWDKPFNEFEALKAKEAPD